MIRSIARRPTCLLLTLGLLLPAAAAATTARQVALGGGDFLEDDGNVLRWSGSLVDYPDAVVGELGRFAAADGWQAPDGSRASGPGLGVHLRPQASGRLGTLAAYLHTRGDDAPSPGLVRDGLGATWSLAWARRTGAFQPALTLRHGTAAADGERPERRRTDLGLGLRWDVADGAYVDLAGEVRKFRNTAEDDSERDGDAVAVRARAFVRLGAATALVPLLEYVDADRPAPVAGQLVRGHLARAGLGLNWYPDPDHVLVAGVQGVRRHVDLLDAADPAAPTVLAAERRGRWTAHAGFESRFRYWLMLRGSLRWTSGADDEPAAFGLAAGASVQLGPADLDLALADRGGSAPDAGPSADPAGDPAPRATATLRWRF